MSQAFDQYIDNLKKKEKSAAGTSAALSASQQNVPYYQTRSEANNLYNQAKTLKDSLFTIQDNDLLNAYQKAGVLGRYSDSLMGRYAIDPAGIAYQSPLFRGQGTVKQTEELMGIVRPLGGNNINQRLTAPQIRMNAVSNRLSGDMDYDTYKKLMDSQIGVGDADTQRLLMTYGGGTVEKGTARMAAAAAASATSMEALEDMLAKARTDTERAAINAEISKRQSRRIDKSGIGQYGLGNIDLYNRKPYTNEDGSISTVDSFSVNIDGQEVLLPSIIDGRRVTDEEAIAHYMKTGEHLGKFNTPEEADDYAKRLHIQQEDLYTDPEDAYRNGLYRAMPPEMQAYVDEYDQSDMPLTNDEMRDMLRGERDKLQASYRADMTAEEKRMLRLRTEEMDRALNDIETEKAGPIYQTPEMQAFSTWQEQGKDTSYLTRYQQDAAQEAQDWTDVTRGRYYGEDKEKQESSDKIEQLTDEYNALVSTVGGITDPQEYATTMQRMEEIETELDALNTVAEQKAGSEGEKLDAIKTAQHGEADLGRYAKALGNEALKMWQNALGGISASATRAGEMLYGIGKNLVTEGGEGLGDTIVDIYQNGTGAKMERYYKKQLDDAVEESYHARKAISDSPVLDVAHSILVNGLEMIPDIAMTLMTNGANKAADATVMLQNAMMNYMSSLGQGQVQRLMANMSTNPSFYTSFVREWASDIQDLKEKKVPVGLAEVLGTFTAGINAMLEVGSGGDSGIQMIGKDADDGIITRGYKALTGNDAGKAIQAVDRGFQMGLGEGTEEITQGIESAAFQGMGKALATGEGTKAVSLTPGEEALINVPDLAYEGMVGALSGVAMGGATDTVNRAAETKAQNREIGEQIINNNWGEALGGIAEDAAGISNDTTKALREGTADLSSKKIKQKVGQLYKQMMDKLDKASTNRIQIQMERSIENAMIRNDFPATSREQLKAAAKAVAKAYGLGPQSLNETEMEIMQRPEVQEVYEGLTGENAEFQDQFGPATLRKGREAQQAMNQARVMLMTRNMTQEEVIQRTKENLNENVAEEDRDALAAAIVKQENGQELSEAESKALDKYGLNMDAMGDEYGTETAYNYGRSGRSQEELARNLRSAGIDVTDEVRQQYQQGEKERIQAEQNRIQQIRELNQGGKNGQRNGVVRGASEREAQYYNVKQIDAGKLTTKQKAAIEALRTVAGKMNLNIALFESQTNEKGTHVGANGFYDESTDTVYLDIFAGYEKNEQAILRTAAHELTHVIQQWSPQEYANLRDYLLESYYGQGENTVAQLIQHQMDIARRSGRNMTEPQAMDELVADACEMMLGDAEGAARMAQKNPSLFEKIKNWISDFVQAIKAAMEGVDPQTREARLLAGMQERFEKARDLWYAGFNQAAENRGGGMNAEIAPEKITSQENLSAAPAENAGAAVAQPAAEAPRRTENGQKRVTITKHEVNANRGIAYTNDQTPVSFHYEAVPVDSLITSNNQRFEANPDYPQELQPRDRTRTASREQVYGIARNLNPARLGQSADVQNGAPIVGSDLVVESGNGRTMALRYAMQNMPGQAQQYTAWLRQNAARFGLDPASIQEDSVLVRVRDSAMDRTAFVKAANESTTAAYSESEAAESDAEKLTPAMMQIFEPGENGELNAAGNSAFANRYMEQVIPAAERGNYMQADGTISQRGWERIQNGIFQKAYGSAALTQMLSESTDEGGRNILKAMLRAAPRAVQTAEQIRQGNTWDIGLGDMLTNAAKRYLQLKRDGIKLDTYLNQTTMPGLETEDAGTQALMRAFEDLNRAPRRLGNVLQNVMDLLEEYGDPRQVNMLGESTAPDAAALISQAVARENQSNAEGIKQSARDSAYLQAVESGDTEEQQRLVDEAAEEALSKSIVRNSDGSLKKVYHGTGAMFNQFSYDFMSAHGSMEGQGFYFTDNPEMANMYKGPNGRVLEGYLDMRKTLSDSKKTMTRAQLRTLLQKIDPTGDDILINYERSGGVGYPGAAWKARALNDTVDTIYSGSDSDSEMLAEIANSGAGTELTVKMAREMGFDGYIVKDKYTSGKHSGEVYVAFESSQFKQSDPVTYDDQGDVIPLSERFNPGNNDIRYSARDTETEPAEGKPETTIDGMVETKKMPGGTITRQYSYRSWTADEQQTVLRNLINNGFDRKRAERWIADVNSIAAIIGSDRARLDYDADPNGTFVKPNNEYRVTVDASTLCAKRLLYQGTFNEISRRIPNSPLRPGDLIQLVNMMKDAGHVTPCSICYVESRRRNLGNYAEKFLQEYEGENKPTLAQLTTTDGLANLKNNNPDAYEAFIRAMNKKGTSNPKVVQLRTDYRGDLRNLKPSDIRYINHIGGLRFQSFSDFETVHMIDLMQAVMDGAASHLIAQAYTKVPDFAWVFGPTGIKINLSLIGEGNGLDADGKLIFSDSEGIDHKEAFEIRKTYGKNVGTILVGMNDAHILAAMADDRIDFIIPFHRSGWSKADRARMRNLGVYFDYTMFQNERYFIRNADGSFQKTKNGQYKTVRIPEGNLYPSDYWEYDKSGKENAQIYLKLCAKQGRVPKFARFLVDNKDGSFSLQPDGSTDGYWKLLIDYKMYDNEGNPAPQMAMQPNFNMDKAKEVLAKYEGGANHLPVAEDIVEPFIDWYKQAHPKAKYSQRDTSYEENDNYNTIKTADEGLEADMRGSDGTETHYGNHVKFSMRVTEPRELAFLENQTTIKTYKTMQLIDGHLYPPMAAVVAGSKEDYSVLGQWEKATEHPELIKNGNKFTLNKGRGQGSLAAAYNPYMHSSNLMINDQFSGAYARPNLVTVECEVPSSEATSNYHAEYAKDNTGWHSWHTGVVAGALRHAKGTERKVFLSRWIKPVRIVPDTEVAQHYADLLSGTDVEIPDNVVYPSLLEELKKLNIPIKESGRLNNNTKRSDRDTAYQTNRQILAGALTTIAANESERQMLEQYQNVAGQLDMNERRISQINEELRNLRLEEPGSDRERALLAERKQLEQEITAADRRLYTMERLAPMRRIASQQRAKAENDLQRAREHMQRYREGIVQRERIASIERTSRRLAKWLTAPAGKSGNYVPEALRGPLGEFLLTIDKMSKQRREGGPMTQEDKKFAYQLGQISRMLQSIDDGQTGTTEEQISGMYLDMPKQFTQNLTELVNRVEQRMQQAGARPGGNMLDQMSNEELETLDQSMIAISSSITHINDFMSDSFTKGVRETAAETIRDLDAMKPQGKQGRVRKFLTDFITWDNSMPIFAFERLGKTGRAVFDSMREGQGKLAFNAAKIKEESEKIYTAKEGNDWSREIKEFDFGDGNKIRIPVANLMSLYCLNQREQGIGHLYGEGIRVADFEEGKGARKATVHDKGHVVSEAQVQKMLEALTPRQIEVARKLQHLMSTLGAEWGNYVSMRRFGFRQFTEKNYFPIKSDSDLLPARTDNGTGNELYKLLNMSAAKPLVQKANNRLMLENIFEVFGGHMADMAQYNALALPVLDAVKWFNFKESVQEEGESAKYTSGVRDSIRNAYGQSAIKYVTEFLKDINGGGMTGDTNTDLMKKMLGKYNRVAVAANLRVALLQPLAIIRAGVELPGTSLASGTIKAIPNLKKEVAEMQAHSGIALWKDLGYREMNIGRSLKQQIMHMDTLTDKISDKSMALAGLMDNVTWGAMWKASKEFINRTQPTLTRGSEEYFQAVTKKFEDVVYKTQVVDSMLTKSQLMRSQNNFNKLISSFMSEPTTTFNQLMAVWDKFRVAMKNGSNFSQAFQKHGKALGRTAFYYLLAAAVNTAIEQLMTAYRDDDDYENFQEKYMDGFWETMIDNANPLTLLPGMKQIWESGGKRLLGMDTFDDQNVLTEGINTVVDGIEKIAQGKGTVWGRAYTLAKGLSMTSGLPLHPLMREFQAVWNATAAQIQPDWRLETSPTSKTIGYDILYKALQEKDEERVKYILDRLSYNGASDDAITSNLTNRIKADYASGQISAAEAESRLVDMVGKKANDAYFNVQQWKDKVEDDGEYSRFDKLEAAILSNGSTAEAEKELLDHGYTQKQVDAKKKTLITEAAKDGKITDAQATQMFAKYTDLDKDDAYWRLQGAHYEKQDDDDSYQKYGKLEEAILTGKGYEAAKKELTSHGVKEADVTSKVRSIVTEQVVTQGMTDAKAMDLLKKYGGMDNNEAWIRTQELAYQKATGNSTSSDIAMVNLAIEKHASPKAAIDGLLAHGKEKSSIASSITSKYKQQYLDLVKTNVSQAATLKGQLISIFEYLGYDGKKKISDWENPKKKTK